MTGPLYRLGGLCARHRWVVLMLWVVLATALVVIAKGYGEKTNDNLKLPGTGSQAATDTLTEKFPDQANGTVPIALQAPGGAKLTDKKYADAIDTAVKDVRKQKGVNEATSPLSSDGAGFLSKNKNIGYINLTLGYSPSQLDDPKADRIIDAAENPAKAAGMKAAAGGYLGQEVSQPATEDSEVVGLTMAVIVLLFTFGTFVAMGLPIFTAVFGLASALSIITILGQVTDVPTVAPTLATMIGLGVGIDYALFVVTRHREQLHGGMDVRESIARATATSGGAVVFAGGTVVIALCSLAVARIPLVSALGYMSAIAVLVAVMAATTLLPAILSLVGGHIESLRLPMRQHPPDQKPHGWGRWARFVARNPLKAVVFALAVLIALSVPVLNLHLGQSDTSASPKDTQVRQSYDLITEGFGAGTNGPLLVAVDLSKKAAPDQGQIDDFDKKQDDQQKQQQDKQKKATQQLVAQGVPQQQAEQQTQPTAAQKQQQEDQQKQADEQKKQLENPATDPRLQDLRTDIEKAPDVKSVSQPLVNDSGDAAILNVIPGSSPASNQTEDLVKELRDTTIPAAEKGQGYTANVGGRTAGFVDLAETISDRLPLVILTVVLLSFLVLMLAFRSVLIPLQAGIMNLISIGAAFGVVTFIFQEGHGVALVGLDHAVPVVSFVPLMMFAILFGLSMDYEVFLMTHIKEAWREDGDNHDSIVAGVQNTGRVITSAALIMVSVFCAFILNGDPTVKQFGVGMAVAVAVDATIVRCLLVPAVMVLIGPANWWFPRWLDRLMPKISIEGEEYFQERDAKAKAQA